MAHSEVLRAAVDGSDEALATLIRTYHDRVYRFGRSVCRDHFDTDDAVQEAFVKLARRPDVQRDRGVLSWLMSVVRNTCLRMFRHSAQARPLLAEQASSHEESMLRPDVLLDRFRLVQEVHAAIATLPLDYRKVLILRDLEGLSGEKVARMLQLPEATMKTRLHRARQQLRARLIELAPKGLRSTSGHVLIRR